MFNGIDDWGCDPYDSETGESQQLATIVNMLAHEVQEVRTNPDGGGYVDACGEENGDKCAWVHDVPFVTFPNGKKYKLQSEWSNNAFRLGTGSPDEHKQPGCISSGP